jgi:DGQHR domain-containing protein
VLSVIDDDRIIIHTESKTIQIPENLKFGEVIDGQHRLEGLKISQCEMSLPVVLMFGLTREEQAYVFTTINSTQTKVNKSLIYDLYGLSESRSPYRTCHEVARALNKMPNSPFYNRLKMLGKKMPDQDKATLSQGTFVKALVNLISRDPEKDARFIKNNQNLERYENLPLRVFFINNQDAVILKVVYNCFSALKTVFPDLWESPENNILWKTTGYCGIMGAMPLMIEVGVKKKTLELKYFEGIFAEFKKYIDSKGIKLTSEFFPGGGGQNQKKIASYIKESMGL